MGMHCSGTHALARYLQEYFYGEHQPRQRHLRHSDDGTIELADGVKIWKHTVPVGPFGLPDIGVSGGHAIVFLTVRNILPWMISLSRKPYEIHRVPRKRRPRGSV